MKFRFSVILILFITLSSCIKELEIEKSGYSKKLVLWAVLSIDSNISINLSGNRGVKDEDTLTSEIADILLYQDDILIKKLNSVTVSGRSNNFNFYTKALKNKTYKFEIQLPSKVITASSATSETLAQPDITLSKGENAQLKYTIKDYADYKDAYQFDLKAYYTGTLYDTLLSQIIDSNYTFEKKFDKFDEPSLNYNVITSYQTSLQSYTFPVNDLLFNGKNKTFVFFLSNPVSNNIYVSSGKIEKGQVERNILICKKRYVVAKCRVISDEYYQFLLTESKNNAIFGTSYYNPVNLYSNVNGGLGLLATQSERCDTVWILK